MPLKGKSTRLAEGESSIERVIGTRLRTALLNEIGLLTVSVEGEYLNTMADQENRHRTLSD